jgi:hypothetical protein
MQHATGSFEVGYISRPTDSSATQGSIEIDPNKLRFRIVSRVIPVQGMTVHKVGRRTGWTYGAVDQACANIHWNYGGVDRYLLCQGTATYGKDGGDSGAPVFVHVGDSTVYLVGVHQGVAGNGKAIYSRIDRIEADHGTITVEKPFVSVTISGPTYIETPGTYAWQANPSYGDGSYTYQWSVYWWGSETTDMLGTAQTQQLYICCSTNGPFDMRVTVWSAGEEGSNLLNVYNAIGGGGGPEAPRKGGR